METRLVELEMLTAALRASDPEDFEGIEALLERRGLAIGAVIAAGIDGATPSERARLADVLAAGEQFAERLRLVSAGARDRMRELHRLQLVSRALGSQQAAEPAPSSTLAVLA